MGVYYVDVESTSRSTYQVEADTPEEAESRYSDGIVVHSEGSTPAVVNVALET